MREENKKVIMVAYILLAALTALTVGVLFETFAAASGFIAKLYAQEIFRHGVSLGGAVLVFTYLILNKKARNLSDEVVTETKKVVWPSRKDTSSMTVVACVMLFISCVILFVMDFLSREIVSMILG